MRINADTGLVDALYSVSALAALSVRENTTAGTGVNPLDVVANGIAFDHTCSSKGAGCGAFILTGKLWDKYFRADLESPPSGHPALSPSPTLSPSPAFHKPQEARAHRHLGLAVAISLVPVLVLLFFIIR